MSNVRKQLQDSSDDIHLLQSFHRNVQRFRRRQVFFRQGDSPDHVYFLARGSVVVRFHDENLKLESESRVNPGQFFGELGLLKNAPRKGTAVALSDAHVCVIDGGSFREMYEKNRWLKGFIDAVLGIYHVPTHGLITQYEGRFVQQPAIQTTIQKPNEETIIASRVIHADIFAIHYSDTSQVVASATIVVPARPKWKSWFSTCVMKFVPNRGRNFGNQNQSADPWGGVSALTRSSDGGQRSPFRLRLVRVRSSFRAGVGPQGRGGGNRCEK